MEYLLRHKCNPGFMFVNRALAEFPFRHVRPTEKPRHENGQPMVESVVGYGGTVTMYGRMPWGAQLWPLRRYSL